MIFQAARDGDPEQMRKILDDITGDDDRIKRKVMTVRQTDRQTDRQTERQTDRHHD